MSRPAHAFVPAAARRAFPLTRVVIVGAMLAALAGWLLLSGPLAAMSHANTNDAHQAGREVAMRSAQAATVMRADSSVPDASAAFAGRAKGAGGAERNEEPASTF